jgi:hypothetical protein
MQIIRSTKNPTDYTIFDGETYLGKVSRRNHWTVRGTRITWMATRHGSYVSTESTRKDAINALAAVTRSAANLAA